MTAAPIVPAPALTVRPTAELAGEPVADPAYRPPATAEVLTPDPSRRTEVSFLSDGIRLTGHLYRPPGAGEGDRTPAIVMCGPITSVKEMTLPHYAERFADAGYTVLTFDPRGLGASDAAPGRPRWHYDPAEVIRDYHNAVVHVFSRPDVDTGDVSAVGVCMGGSYAVSVGAREHRLRAVACVAGGSDCGDYLQQWLGPDGFANYVRTIDDLLQREHETGEVAYVPSIARGLDADTPVAVMPFPAAYDYYDRTSRAEAPTWSRQHTAASLPAWFAYSAVRHAAMVAPTPLLFVHGTRDLELPPEYMQEAYLAARGPKAFTWVESGDHFQFYNQGPFVTPAVTAVLLWLRTHGSTAVPAEPAGVAALS